MFCRLIGWNQSTQFQVYTTTKEQQRPHVPTLRRPRSPIFRHKTRSSLNRFNSDIPSCRRSPSYRNPSSCHNRGASPTETFWANFCHNYPNNHKYQAYFLYIHPTAISHLVVHRVHKALGSWHKDRRSTWVGFQHWMTCTIHPITRQKYDDTGLNRERETCRPDR